MKVLLSAFQCRPGHGSEPGNGWHWAMSLADLGHEVTVLTSSWDREAILAAGPKNADFRFIDVPPSPLLHRLFPRLAIYRSYRRWQESALAYVGDCDLRCDVAHHVTWASLHLGSRLWRLPVPFVYGPIGGGQTAPAGYWRYFGSQWPAETLRTAFGRWLLPLNARSRETTRNSAVTLVANSATAAASERLGAANVRFMMADGLPLDWVGHAHPRPAGVPVVLWVGRLLPHKAPVLAVEAFRELRRTMDARLVMAGDGPLRDQVSSAVSRLGLTDHVRLLGHVPWNSMMGLYDSSSVFLFTSLRETFGAPFLEALGRGVPAVAVDLHGIADVNAGPGAVKVPLTARPRDLPGTLAVALRTVLTDDGWERRSAAAVAWAADRAWPAKAAEATRLYEELVRAGVRARP